MYAFLNGNSFLKSKLFFIRNAYNLTSTLNCKNYSYYILVFFLVLNLKSFSQVGIGTTSPDASSLLQIDDGAGNKGVLIPQVALSATNVSAPITSPATSLLVYNTAISSTGTTAVVPGFYYWDGLQWVAVGGNNENVYNTNGTLTADRTMTFDDFDLNFDNRNREINFNNGNNNSSFTRNQLSFSFGGSLTPLDFRHSINTRHNANATIGNAFDFILWNPGTANNTLGNRLAFTIGADAVVVNEDSNDIDFRIETDGATNTFVVDAALDNIGIGVNNPSTKLHVGGTSSVVRVDAFNSTNNANNNGTRNIPVMANANGDLVLGATPSNMEYIYNGVDSIPLTTLNTGSNGGLTALVLDTSGEFTITQNAFIQINYAASFSVSTLLGGSINDEKSRLIRNRLNIYNTSSGADVLLERGGHDSVAYTNQSGAGSVTIGGFFSNSGSTAILLTPGTYRVDLEATVASNTADNGNTGDAFRSQWFVENFKVIASY